MLFFTQLALAASLLAQTALGAAIIKRADEDNSNLVELATKLKSAPSALQREKLLTSEDRKFDFFNPTVGVASGKDGYIVSGNADTFPAVIGNGVALSIGILGPCGLNTPHTHRATEYNLAINGTLDTVFFLENGADTVVQRLAPGQATVFPAGGIHAEMNIGCDTAMFVAAFSTEDPGVQSAAQALFQQGRSDFTAATLGDIGVQQVEDIAGGIPEAIAFGIDECLDRCGLSRSSE